MDSVPAVEEYILLSAIFILSCAFFAAAETAIISLNDNKLRELAEQGNKSALLITRMVSEPSRFLTTVQIGVVFSHIAVSAFVSEIFSANFIKTFDGILKVDILSEKGLHIIVTVLISIMLTFFTLLFGHNIPKKIAAYYCDKMSFAFAPLLIVFYVIFLPLIASLSFCTKIILKLFGVNYDCTQDDVTEEEIRMLVEVGKEKGIIEQSERDMIDNIFEFDETTVCDIMTHRTELVSASKTLTAFDAAQLSLEYGYSRIPVYEDDIDNIVGFLNIKDLLALVGENPQKSKETMISEFIRPAMFIPESNRCSDLFATFKKNKMQIAVVVDEYGGTSGIVTMEDLLESIVGNIQDEYDNEVEEIICLSEGVYSLDGSINIEDIEKLMKISIVNAEDYDTLGGFITDITGGIPQESEHPFIVVDDTKFTVLEVKDRRIARVKAEKIIPE